MNQRTVERLANVIHDEMERHKALEVTRNKVFALAKEYAHETQWFEMINLIDEYEMLVEHYERSASDNDDGAFDGSPA